MWARQIDNACCSIHRSIVKLVNNIDTKLISLEWRVHVPGQRSMKKSHTLFAWIKGPGKVPPARTPLRCTESVRRFSVTNATYERGKPSGETTLFTISRSATGPRTFSLFAVSRRFCGLITVAIAWNEFAKVIAKIRPANIRINLVIVAYRSDTKNACFVRVTF